MESISTGTSMPNPLEHSDAATSLISTAVSSKGEILRHQHTKRNKLTWGLAKQQGDISLA